MAKYFIDVVQDSNRTDIGIPVKTKKSPLTNQYTARGTAFRPGRQHPFRAPPGTDKECVLCIFHKGSAVATRLIVSFLEALQVCIKANMARKRLRQVKADLTVLSIQPGGELRDQTVCPPPGLVTMPSITSQLL